MTSYQEYDSSSLNSSTTGGESDIISGPGQHDVLFGRGGKYEEVLPWTVLAR